MLHWVAAGMLPRAAWIVLLLIIVALVERQCSVVSLRKELRVERDRLAAERAEAAALRAACQRQADAVEQLLAASERLRRASQVEAARLQSSVQSALSALQRVDKQALVAQRPECPAGAALAAVRAELGK